MNYTYAELQELLQRRQIEIDALKNSLASVKESKDVVLRIVRGEDVPVDGWLVELMQIIKNKNAEINRLKGNLEIALNAAPSDDAAKWDNLEEFKRSIIVHEKLIEKHTIDGLMLLVNAGYDYRELVDHLTSEQARLSK